VGGLAYLPDVATIPEPVWQTALKGLDVWIVDALRRTPHPTHSHLAQTLEWIERAAPKQAILTDMHADIDCAAVEAETPAHISAAYDGMEIEFDA
jgi:phosphoribosyl 1,2-cyclic phosphate phosphodiesterase